jgi:hypothetical protein
LNRLTRRKPSPINKGVSILDFRFWIFDYGKVVAMNPQARSRLNALYPAISGINAPLWYTIEQNIFQEYGLEGVPRG